jgi:hypothetical protein
MSWSISTVWEGHSGRGLWNPDELLEYELYGA